MATVYPGTVTVESLANALDSDGDGSDLLDNTETAERITQAFDTATALVDAQFDQAFKAVPDEIVDQVKIEVGMEIYKRTDAPAGASQYVDQTGGQQVRGPRDPLNRSWPIIRQYVLPL